MRKKCTVLSLARLATFIVALLMLSVTMPKVSAFANIKDKATGLICNKEGEIVDYSGSKVDLVIPEKIGNIVIKDITFYPFNNNKKLKSVTIPKTMTAIPNNAFNSCTSLETVKLPKTLKFIQYHAFEGCTALKNIQLPDGLKSIGEGAFSGCSSLSQINLPESITSIGEIAFKDTAVSDFHLPEKVTCISEGLLWGTPLKTFVVPKAVKRIDSGAFTGCSKLTSLTIPKTVTRIYEDIVDRNPQLTIYGEYGTVAQEVSVRQGVHFVDITAGEGKPKTVVLSDPIVVPASTVGKTVNAAPSKTKLVYKNKTYRVEAYTIDKEDYYRLTDLGFILKEDVRGFGPGYDTVQCIVQLNGAENRSSDTPDKLLYSKGYGTAAKATRVYPAIRMGIIDVSYDFRVYSIHGENFYSFSDTMDIIDCGAFLNKKTGVVTLDPRYRYEPFNSPVFSAVPKGNADYRKVQQDLYNAYLNRLEDFKIRTNTIPDNGILYVPRGVAAYQPLSSKTHFGNHSKFIVRGGYIAQEEPANALHLKTKKTKDVVMCKTFYQQPRQEGNAVVNIADFNTQRTQFKSVSLSYGNITHGVQSIYLNFTRDKYDPFNDVNVYFNVVGGESYSCYYNARYSIDLSSALATVVGKNIGRNARINKLLVRNATNHYFGDYITLPVDWTISTSGKAPSEPKTANYVFPNINSSPDAPSFFTLNGLSNNSYLTKYLLDKDDSYAVLSPENNYTAVPFRGKLSDAGIVEAYDPADKEIMGDTARIALYTGKKTTTGKDSYSFIVSPLSEDIVFSISDREYPVKGDLSFEGDKTYLSIAFNKYPLEGSPYYDNSAPLMVKYHKKGDPENTLEVLYYGNAIVDKYELTGKLELTKELTELTNRIGATSIDKLYLYSYDTRNKDDFNVPSEKYAVVPCSFTSTAIAFAKLGSDTKARILAPTVSTEPPAANESIEGKLSFRNVSEISIISQIRLSPAGQNKWGKNQLDDDLWSDQSKIYDFSYQPASPRFDIEVTVYRETKYILCRNVDFTGITAQYGATISLKVDDATKKLTATVHNNLPLKPTEPGEFGTDTIDVTLLQGTTSGTFDVKDFSLVEDDGLMTPFDSKTAKIISLSQSTPGAAKLTLARYYGQIDESKEYDAKPILLYKGYPLGLIEITNN